MTSLLLSILLLAPSNSSLNSIFYAASSDESLREAFHDRMAEMERKSNTEMVYYGASMALMASEYINPYQKLSAFNKGTDLIDEGISNDPSNAELRFVRYLIQSYAPAFLNYNDQLDDDLRTIEQAIDHATTKSVWMKNYESYKKASENETKR